MIKYFNCWLEKHPQFRGNPAIFELQREFERISQPLRDNRYVEAHAEWASCNNKPQGETNGCQEKESVPFTSCPKDQAQGYNHQKEIAALRELVEDQARDLKRYEEESNKVQIVIENLEEALKEKDEETSHLEKTLARQTARLEIYREDFAGKLWWSEQ